MNVSYKTNSLTRTAARVSGLILQHKAILKIYNKSILASQYINWLAFGTLMTDIGSSPPKRKRTTLNSLHTRVMTGLGYASCLPACLPACVASSIYS